MNRDEESTHTAAGFLGRRHWLIKPCWALLKGRCLGGGCWGRHPALWYTEPTLHICASFFLLPLQAPGPKYCRATGPLSCAFCLSVSVLDWVPAALPSFLRVPRSLSSSNPAQAHCCLPRAVSSSAYPHPEIFWGRFVTEKDQRVSN